MSQTHNEQEVPQWDLADRMAKALRESGVTTTAMGEYLCVHRNTINNYLHGRRGPNRPTLILWAMRTGVPLEWLLTGQQPSTSGPGNTRGYPSDAPFAYLSLLPQTG